MLKPGYGVRVPVSGSSLVIGILVCFFSFVLFLISSGNLGAALVPIIALGAVTALFYFPLEKMVLFFFALVLLTSGGPCGGKWPGPLSEMGNFVASTNLNGITGISALAFSVMQLATMGFLFVMLLRTVLRNNVDNHLSARSHRQMKIALFLSLGAVVFSTVWGIQNGGEKEPIPFQMKNLLFLPLVSIVFFRAFKSEQVFPLMAKLLIGICVLRIAEGAWFYFTIAKPQALDLEYIMSHDDSFTFATGIVVLVLAVMEAPTRRNIRNLVVYGGIIMWGIVVNDRRVCYVALALCFILIYFYISPWLRKKLNRLLLYLAPVLILYFGVGMHSTAPIFAPVQSMVSVGDENNPSNISRKIENANMCFTISNHPILGTGFGFPYSELMPPVTLHFYYWKHLAHNHLLWLTYLMGGVGFFFFFLPMAMGTYLGFRIHAAAQTSNQRIAALTAICIIVIYFVMAFGDMGTTSIYGSVLVALALSIFANLSTQLKTG